MQNLYSAEKEKYYYAFDEKVYLFESENKIVVSYDATEFSNVKNFSQKTFNSKQIEWKNNNVFIVTLDVLQNSSSEKKKLLMEKGVKSVQPLYMTKDGMEMEITDEIVVKFRADISRNQIEEFHKKYQIIVKKETNLYQLLSVPKELDLLEIANKYWLSGLVQYSHPNFTTKIELHQILPTDPYFVNQFYLYNTGQTLPNGHSGTTGADINVLGAWNVTKGNSDVIVAVLDQGVTSNHPDLPNNRQLRLNGSNFADGNINNPSPTTNDNHGNSCAGVIAASHNNEGISGIAPNCKIMPIRIFDSNGYGISSTSLADAITFAKNNGAHVISNSWGYSSSNPNFIPIIKDAIIDAVTNGRNGKGCIVVFSAGNTANHISNNEGFICFPSNVNIAGVLTVGASDRYDYQANYSPSSNLTTSNNQVINIVAPSHKAYSCQIPTETFEAWSIDIPGNEGYNPVKNVDCGTLPIVGYTLPNSGTNYLAYTGHFGGTSCSCPEVAAVAALILSVNPNLTQLQVANIIESTARKAGGYNYQITSGLYNGTWNHQMGYGVLDAGKALQLAQATLNNPAIIGKETLWGGCTEQYLIPGSNPIWSCSGVPGVTIDSNTGILQVPNDSILNGTITVTANHYGQIYTKQVQIIAKYPVCRVCYLDTWSGEYQMTRTRLPLYFPVAVMPGNIMKLYLDYPAYINGIATQYDWNLISGFMSLNSYSWNPAQSCMTINFKSGSFIEAVFRLQIKTGIGTINPIVNIGGNYHWMNFAMLDNNTILISEQESENPDNSFVMANQKSVGYRYEIQSIYGFSQSLIENFNMEVGRQKRIDISTLSPGLYVLNIYKNGQKVFSKKFRKN